MSDPQPLRIDELDARHPGLTPALGGTYTEAASVCFARYHEPPVDLCLKNGATEEVRVVQFDSPDERVRNAHANEIDATEAGAYGVSLAAVETMIGVVAVRRAETLTGADWYVAAKGTHSDDLESCFRLEVSGVSAGTSADVQRRLREKLAQAARGQSNLPAIAAVVGFKALEVSLALVGEVG